MITKEEAEKAGYTILPSGGYFVVSAEDIPHDWYELCVNYGADPSCKELILCVCGYKEIYEENEE